MIAYPGGSMTQPARGGLHPATAIAAPGHALWTPGQGRGLWSADLIRKEG